MNPDEATSDRSTVVEYRDYLPHESASELADSEEYRRVYGYVRSHFKRRKDRYGDYQRWLSQARIGTTFDIYLARTVVITGVAALAGAGLAAVGLTTLVLSSVLTVSVPVGGVVVLLGALLSGGIVGGGHLYYPRLVAYHRQRQIDVVLPHAVVFLSALSRGGLHPIALINELTEVEEIYGAVAGECKVIRKDVELFNDDLGTALKNAGELSPSQKLGDFFDDFASVLESGGSVEEFLGQEATAQLERTEEELEELLEALVTLAEAYVTLIVVGPLLLIVVLAVLGLTGASTVLYLSLLTYVGLPLGIAGSIVAITILTRPHQLESGSQVDRDQPHDGTPDTPEPWFSDYQQGKRRRWLHSRLRKPLALMRRRPLVSLLVSVPVALVFVLSTVELGLLTPSWTAYAKQPIRFTTGFVVTPLLIVSIPVMGFHESRRRRERRIEQRFHDVLQTLASASNRGVPLADGIELVSRRYGGPLGREFERIHRDIRLDNDIGQALSTFANRLQLPYLSMAITVITEVVHSTDKVATPLQVLADDLDTRLSLRRRRKREMDTYLVVVALGILVYLLLILVLDVFFLSHVTEIPLQSTLAQRRQPMFMTKPPVTAYRTVFFHSALIQAFGNGLLMGKLSDDSLLSGLKYSNAFVSVVLLAFFALKVL